jgi:hypothetical protein
MAEETPKSPKNPESEKAVYVSKCLVCGHAMSVHGHEPDEHGYPYLPVTDEDVKLWTAAGDSPYAIEKRILVRGRTHG